MSSKNIQQLEIKIYLFFHLKILEMYRQYTSQDFIKLLFQLIKC